MVFWTLNLHANCGSIPGSVDLQEAEVFVEELERRLQEPVSLDTIDWVWDEYVRLTRNGQSYSDSWRPTRPDKQP